MCCVGVERSSLLDVYISVMLENDGGVAVFGCLFTAPLLQSGFYGSFQTRVTWSGVIEGRIWHGTGYRQLKRCARAWTPAFCPLFITCRICYIHTYGTTTHSCS